MRTVRGRSDSPHEGGCGRDPGPVDNFATSAASRRRVGPKGRRSLPRRCRRWIRPHRAVGYGPCAVLRCLRSPSPAGSCWPAAFEPFGCSLPAARSAVAGLVAVRARPAAAAGVAPGLVFGVAFYVSRCCLDARRSASDAWIGLSRLEAAFFGLLGVAVSRCSRLPRVAARGPRCWVASRRCAGVPVRRLPLGRLAFATVDTPFAAALPYVGTTGVSFLVALLGTTLAWVVLPSRLGATRRGRRRRGRAAPSATARAPALVPYPLRARAARPRVAAVQGNVPGRGHRRLLERRAGHATTTSTRPDLAAEVDAGEAERPTSCSGRRTPPPSTRSATPTVHADIRAAVDAIGVPILVGAMVDGPARRRCSTRASSGDPGTGPPATATPSATRCRSGSTSRCATAAAAADFDRLDQIPRDMVPGTEPGAARSGRRCASADAICFEVAYDDGIPRPGRAGRRAARRPDQQRDLQPAPARSSSSSRSPGCGRIETGRTSWSPPPTAISGIIAPTATVRRRAPARGHGGPRGGRRLCRRRHPRRSGSAAGSGWLVMLVARPAHRGGAARLSSAAGARPRRPADAAARPQAPQPDEPRHARVSVDGARPGA